MKQRYSLISALTVLLLLTQVLTAQVAFEGTDIRARLRSYGNFELYTLVEKLGPPDTLNQIDRMTPLLGLSKDAVFDYSQDADDDLEPTLAANPAKSDHEIQAALNNYYSFLPPDVHIGINIYGWSNTNYIVMRYRITNIGDDAYTGTFGFEYIPYVNDEYGFETVAYLEESGIMDVYKTAANTHIAFKFLSHPMASMNTIVWYDGYNGSDSLLWNFLDYGAVDTNFVSPDADGTVVIPSIAPLSFEPESPVDVYVAIAYGRTESIAVSAINAAETAWMGLITSLEDRASTPDAFRLRQNIPNPFNPATEIRFSLQQPGQTRLSIYDSRGALLQQLLNADLPAGDHSVRFNAGSLPSGVYLYRLERSGFSESRKMLLLK